MMTLFSTIIFDYVCLGSGHGGGGECCSWEGESLGGTKMSAIMMTLFSAIIYDMFALSKDTEGVVYVVLGKVRA